MRSSRWIRLVIAVIGFSLLGSQSFAATRAWTVSTDVEFPTLATTSNVNAPMLAHTYVDDEVEFMVWAGPTTVDEQSVFALTRTDGTDVSDTVELTFVPGVIRSLHVAAAGNNEALVVVEYLTLGGISQILGIVIDTDDLSEKASSTSSDAFTSVSLTAIVESDGTFYVTQTFAQCQTDCHRVVSWDSAGEWLDLSAPASIATKIPFQSQVLTDGSIGWLSANFQVGGVYVVRFDDGIWTTSASAIAAFRPILIANESASDAGGLGLIMWLDAFVDSNNQEVEELKIVRILPNGNLSNAFAAPDTLFVPVEPQTAWIDDAGTAYVMMTNQGSVRVDSIRADGTYVAGAILSNRPALLSRMVGLGDGTKLVVWSEPKAIGFAAALKSYVIGSDLASGRNTIVESVASDGYAFDLSANVEAFTVFSSDLSGENAGLASLEFLPPSSPQNVTIKRTGATTAQVEWATTWTDPETFTVALVGGGFNVSQQTSSKSVSLANLNPAVTYTVSVVSSSNGKQSAPTSVTLKAVRPAVAPAAISIKPVKVKNQKQFKVEWKKPGNLGGSAVVRYEVQVKIGTSAWKPLAKLAPTKYAFTTTKLSAGKNYQFRVRAVTYVNGVFKTSKTVKA